MCYVLLTVTGYSDPFCNVKMNDVKLFMTKVKKKTLSPVWNETVTLQVNNGCDSIDIVSYSLLTVNECCFWNVIAVTDSVS